MEILPFKPQNGPKLVADYFIYVQVSDETDYREIQEISNEEFSKMADFNIIYGVYDIEREGVNLMNCL